MAGTNGGMKMNCYYVYDKNGEHGQAVIAADRRKAILEAQNILDCDYIDIRAKIIKNANIDGLPEGLVDLHDALLRKIFDYVYDADCPSCGKSYTTLHRDDNNENKIVCFGCNNNARQDAESDKARHCI